MGRRPTGRTSPSSTGAVAVPTSTRRFSACSSPGLSSGAPAASAGRTGPSPRRSPRKVVHAPGLRGDGADQPVDGHRGLRPVDPRVVDGDLRCVRDPLGRLRPGHDRAVRDPVDRRGQQRGTGHRQAAQQVARGVRGGDGLGHHPVHGPGVEALLQPEGRGAGDLVAVPQRGLHGRGAAPGGQQREVQVDPPEPGHVQRRPRHQRTVGDDHAAVRRQRAQGVEEPGLGQPPRRQHRDPGLVGQRPDGRADQPPPAPGGSVRPGQHGDDLVPGVQQRPQRRHGRLRGAGEQQPQPGAGSAHRGHRAFPNSGCGLTLTTGGGPPGPPNQSAERISAIACLRVCGVEAVDEQHAVEVVDLVLDAAGQDLGALDRHRLAVHVEPAGHHVQVPAAVPRHPGDRQAALGTELLLVADRLERRVDQVPGEAPAVVGEHAQPDAQLRRGEPGAALLVHRVGQVGDQLAQLRVEGRDLHRRGAQHRVAEEPDGLDGHGSPSTRAGRRTGRHARVGATDADAAAGAPAPAVDRRRIARRRTGTTPAGTPPAGTPGTHPILPRPGHGPGPRSRHPGRPRPVIVAT